MVLHHPLLKTVAILLLFAAYAKSDCGADVVKYLNCVDEKYTATLGNKIQAAMKEAHGIVSKCFAASSCEAPPLPKSRESPEKRRRKRASTFIEPVKDSVLNEEYFPGANGKVFSEQMGKCLKSKNGENTIVLQCLRKSLPGFEYPKTGVILLATDYVGGGTEGSPQQNMIYANMADLSKKYLEISNKCTPEKATSIHKCISDGFGKKQSEPADQTMQVGNVKKFWCKISSECLAKIKDDCQEKIKHLGSYTCECLKKEKQPIIDRLSKDYEECIGLKPSTSALDSQLSHEISAACLSHQKSVEVCG